MEIMNIFLDLNSEWKTIILATHDSHVVDKLNKRVIAFKDKTILYDEENWKYKI
jgi:ABC-type ATPase involved in cell division